MLDQHTGGNMTPVLPEVRPVAVPSEIHHFPVIAAMLQKPRESGFVEGYVMVQRVGEQELGDFATWHVGTRDAGVTWLASSGRYDMDYATALQDWTERWLPS